MGVPCENIPSLPDVKTSTPSNTIKSSGDLDDDSKKTISEISSKYKKSMGF